MFEGMLLQAFQILFNIRVFFRRRRKRGKGKENGQRERGG
jgi:hypothetical protein